MTHLKKGEETVRPWEKIARPIAEFAKDVRKVIKEERFEFMQTTTARLLSVSLLYPLDVLKTRTQILTHVSRVSIQEAVRGPWMAGVIPALVGYLPHGVIAFSLFSVVQDRLQTRYNQWDSRVRTVVAACVSDAIAALWVAPLELLKVRRQVGSSTHMRCAIRGGQYGLGVPSQVIRDVPFRALYLIAYDIMRNKAEERVGRALNNRETILVGVSVGSFVAAVTTPVDVVRSRMMAQFPRDGRLYSNWLHCAWRLLRHEGIGGAYRGLIPRTVYMGASALLFTVTFEKVKSVVEKKRMATAASAKRK